MQFTPIPASICEEAESVCRNFIWGSTADHRKCHLVSWSKICLPKDAGGLGFRDLRTLNKSYMMKLAWSLVSEHEKVWVRIMKAKYSCGVLSMTGKCKECPLECVEGYCWSLARSGEHDFLEIK